MQGLSMMTTLNDADARFLSSLINVLIVAAEKAGSTEATPMLRSIHSKLESGQTELTEIEAQAALTMLDSMRQRITSELQSDPAMLVVVDHLMLALARTPVMQ